MPRPMKMPHDKDSAREYMKNFSEMAYVAACKDNFEKAIHILYGEDFIVKFDLSQRMAFCCKLCSKDMNSEIALAQHSHSGSHQKNLDRKIREQHQTLPNQQDKKYHHRDKSYHDPHGLQSMLMKSPVKPVGLQMIEQYEKPRSNRPYYKCNLCGAHGRLEAIYKHAIGTRHTEKYIRSRVILKSSILTTKEREFIRELLTERERISMNVIKVYRDGALYPHRWEKHIPSQGVARKKLEAKSYATMIIAMVTMIPICFPAILF